MVLRPSVHNQQTSEHSGWTSLFAASQFETPYEGTFGPVSDQLIVWHRDGPVRIEGAIGGTKYKRTTPSGAIHLIPGGADFSVNLQDNLQTLHVYVRRQILEDVAQDIILGDPAKIQISPLLLDSEEMLGNLLSPLDFSLNHADETEILSTDYLSLAIAAYLVRKYSNGRVLREARHYSPPNNLDRAIEFMRANLHKSISLADISSAVNMSASHFTRMFRAKYSMPPHRYLIGLRVDHAQRLLRETNVPISEIALDCGFSHQEHLTSHFRKALDTTPAAFRKAKIAL